MDRGVLKGFLYNTAVARRAGVASSFGMSRSASTWLTMLAPVLVMTPAPPADKLTLLRRVWPEAGGGAKW